MANIDPLFGLHAQSLAVQRQRMEVLASNIANADTPHYQARDIDFAKVLAGQQQAAQGAAATGATNAPAAANPPLVYRVPLQPAVDGNIVDEQVEQGAFADAAMHYQASLSFLNGEVKGLLTAITGS